MQNQTENRKNKKNDRYSNTERDESNLGVSGNRHNDPAFAEEDQPTYRPPEGQPEPRPVEPIMNPNSNPRTNTNSPT